MDFEKPVLGERRGGRVDRSREQERLLDCERDCSKKGSAAVLGTCAILLGLVGRVTLWRPARSRRDSRRNRMGKDVDEKVCALIKLCWSDRKQIGLFAFGF